MKSITGTMFMIAGFLGVWRAVEYLVFLAGFPYSFYTGVLVMGISLAVYIFLVVATLKG